MPSEQAPPGGKERWVRDAHRRLRDLYADVRDTLSGDASDETAGTAFKALREALDVHFEQEDRLYYPAIGSLRPALAAGVAAFAEQHRRFRQALAVIESLLDTGDRAGALRAFGALTRELERHEADEEAMLGEVDRSAAGR